MRDDLNRVGIEVIIGNSLGRGVENGWDVVFGFDMAGDGGRVWDQDRFLNVALKNLAAGWG